MYASFTLHMLKRCLCAASQFQNIYRQSMFVAHVSPEPEQVPRLFADISIHELTVFSAQRMHVFVASFIHSHMIDRMAYAAAERENLQNNQIGNYWNVIDNFDEIVRFTLLNPKVSIRANNSCKIILLTSY